VSVSSASDSLGLVGATPVVRINKLNPNPKVTLWAKVEGDNPFGANKDRIAKTMIEGAEARGELTPEKVILEATSGNTGIGLAWVARLKGYRCEIVMPESMSIERRRILAALGAKVVLSPGAETMGGAIARAEEMRGDPRYWMPHQFENADNVRAHYEGTAAEIIAQVGHVDSFVAGIGTGGTLMGASRRLREDYPDVRVIGVEPFFNDPIQGLKNLDEGYVPPIWDGSCLTEKVNVSRLDAFAWTRRLLAEEAIFAGESSGAAMCAAVKECAKLEGGTVVVVLPDRGEKYLSTELFV
jgi:S-sulfo-L-cysteine synthase (O-acetyl-L-serine-dependent)